MKFIFLILTFFTISTYAADYKVVNIPIENTELELNMAIEQAYGPTRILLPEGKFYLKNEIIITQPNIILEGVSKKKTILSFAKQVVGAQGIVATGDNISFRNFTIEDTWGNAIKVIGSDGVTFQGLRVRWSRGPSPENGAYGLYPVLTKNVLIEDCEVSDTSDAGIYVGQSKHIIVRRNLVYENVAGIEVENSDFADVYENQVTNNTAGVLIFNLPDLIEKDGKQTRIFNNDIYDNNLPNFAIDGTIISTVPKGVGIYILSGRKTEVFNNRISGYKLAGIAISNYYATGRKIQDPGFDPMPRGIHIYNNEFFNRKKTGIGGRTQIAFLLRLLMGYKAHEVIYDGIDDGTYNGEKPIPGDRICIRNNISEKTFRFANLHLDNSQWWLPFPGGPVTKDLDTHDCDLVKNPKAVVTGPGSLPDPKLPPSEEEVLKFCKADVDGVNWAALKYDCPSLADYNLFLDPKDPRQNPVGGQKYVLNNKLFTDYAAKDRFFFVPEGESLQYTPQFAFNFPNNSVITKTFSYGERLMETRLLIKRDGQWAAVTYTWDKNTRESFLSPAGFTEAMKIQVSGQVKDINYHAPNLRQCASCHFINGRMVPIGPRAKFLNRHQWNNKDQNQLAAWITDGLVENAPKLEDIPKASAWTDTMANINDRAKSYLEINCAHCHNPKGNARNTGLFLSTDRKWNSVEMGYCKSPVAAGLGTGGFDFDIHPGQPKKSILLYRMQSSHPAVMMPQLGRSIAHEEANAVIDAWIAAMPKDDCKGVGAL